ncbi:MAG: Mbov_0395 family pilin-like conjugal transfer protein [Patescibacteria group bacterium]
MSKKLIRTFLPVIMITILSLSMGLPALAQSQIQGQLGEVGTGLGEFATTKSLPATIGTIIKIVLGFLGVVLLIVIIYGGWLWMTAGGDEDQTKKAKSWIVNGIIGLIIILLAYAITNYVVGELLTAVQG